MPSQGPQETVKLAYAITVLVVWATGNFIQYIDPARQVPTAVNAMFGLVVAYFFRSWVNERRKRNGDDDAPP